MVKFNNKSDVRAALETLKPADADARSGAQERNGQLTKPPASLGRLEELAIWYASWRGTDRPNLENPQVVIFAGNHGVAAQGVSAFPPEVTVQMVANFEHGGAAINQLSAAFGAKMDVVALDLDTPTDDFTKGPAMDEAAFCAAFQAGWDSVDADADLLVTGEMGIGNTTSAAAIATAVMGGEATDWVGAGTGVDAEGEALKARVVNEGLLANPSRDPIDILASLGGRELAAMAGAILRARDLSIPVILDGFICTAAASTLFAANSAALDHAIAGHVSAEQAHKKMLAFIGKEPVLSMGMRLGEGSGAALAIGVLKGAIACHSGMATFAEAGVAAGA